MKIAPYLAYGFIVFALIFFLRGIAQAEDQNLNWINNQLEELKKARQLSEAATKPLEAELGKLDDKLTSIQQAIDKAGKDLADLQLSITKREKEFDSQYNILSLNVESFYKHIRGPSAFYYLISAKTASNVIKNISYEGAIAQDQKNQIANITQDLLNLEKDRKKVQSDKVQLANLQTQLDSQAVFFRKEIKGAKDYQSTLSKQIEDLTAQQEALLAAKTGTFQTSVGDVPLADDPASRPDYNPGFSPAFAAFSFGAPHFKGMSQYGAFGRAKQGQSAEDILKAYYGSGIEIKKDYDPNTQITVEGYGGFSLEEYTKRIYEMPGSWGDENGMEALKAQAVAARSYALARIKSSGAICATESCQVFKPEPKGGNWNSAVDATRGWVLMANGSPFSAWYASTSGGYQESYSFNGYSTPGFWDTTSGRSGWTSSAYEKTAGSPWFYKGWYKSRSGNNCGRAHPWLTSTEMADILNAIIVFKNDGSSGPHLSQTDSCLGSIPDTWDKDKVASEADRYGGRVSSVNSVSITYSDSGITSEVVFGTSKGSVPVDGNMFYKVFNLRAPGAVHLTSGLYNIERK